MSEYCKNCFELAEKLAKKEQECEELKEELAIYKKMLDDPEFKIALTDVRTGEREVWRKLGSKTDRYRKALKEIENVSKKGLNSICYKSNCSRCQCYDGDDCNAGMNSLVNEYFTENSEFVDENSDFIETLEALIESERKKCNKAIPIAQQVLDIINKVKGEGNE